MADGPLVSIVVNNYNYAGFVGEAIDSALAQTWPSTEVIVVDDGSTDQSRDVIERYGSHVKRCYKANGGQGSAYNAGFALAEGQYVCFLDADDTLLPHAAADIVKQFWESDVVKVQWPMAITDAMGRPTGILSTRIAPPDGDMRQRVIKEGPLYDFEYHSGSCYRRQMLEEVLPVPEASYVNGADVYLITLAPLHGIVATAREPLGTYRWHGNNNYQSKQLDKERLRNYLGRFEANCAALRKGLAAQGIDIDPQRWRDANFNYQWPMRLLRALEDLESLIPHGASFILADDAEWGMLEPVPGRQAIPFLESDGQYGGPPPDDDTAISELERLREERNTIHFALWWTRFWWLDYYAGFFAYLRSNFPLCLANERLIAFDLRGD